MDRSWQVVKRFVINLKLDLCCWFAPIRIGLFLFAYFNVVYAVVSVMGIADESFKPLLVQVQETLLPDNSTKPVPILAYSTELAFNCILICALHRSDITLLRVFLRYNIVTIIASILVYSLVATVVGSIIFITMIFSILFQIYTLILVRSMIVEIRLARKKLDLPKLVMTTIVEPEKTEKEFKAVEVEEVKESETKEVLHEEVREVKVDVGVETSQEVENESENDKEPEKRLETVDEHPKEEMNEK